MHGVSSHAQIRPVACQVSCDELWTDDMRRTEAEGTYVLSPERCEEMDAPSQRHHCYVLFSSGSVTTGIPCDPVDYAKASILSAPLTR